MITGNQKTLAQSLLGDGPIKDASSSTQGTSLALASGNARQIVGPVSTTFTGPIEKVEAHFAGSPEISLESKLVEWLKPVP